MRLFDARNAVFTLETVSRARTTSSRTPKISVQQHSNYISRHSDICKFLAVFWLYYVEIF